MLLVVIFIGGNFVFTGANADIPANVPAADIYEAEPASSISIPENWVQEDGFWYYYIENVMQTYHWVYRDDYWHYFGEDGKMY